MLTLPAIVEGNQQTAAHMVGDVLKERLAIADGPTWAIPTGPGLGIAIDDDALNEAQSNYQRDGQFLPYQSAT
jgi:L-alanine-DL-glutamate epimerase-like enolase superfamily enzyme